VYIVDLSGGESVGVEYVAPFVNYTGDYGVLPREFDVEVRIGFVGRVGVSGVPVKVNTGWGESQSLVLDIPSGEYECKVVFRGVKDPKLWYPVGMGSQNLYTVSVQVFGGSIVVNRTVGFRSLALVTDNDQDPGKLKGLEGSGNLTMRFVVNGRALYSRGASVIPLEELEARNNKEAIRRMVEWAAAANMNMLRLWGGGVYQYEDFYEACDEYGVLVFHDLMFTDIAMNNQSGHYFTQSHTENLKEEIYYQILRLTQHPSIFLWDSCNECMLFGHYDDWAINVVASVDTSRLLWPSSPSYGWLSGVDRLTGLRLSSSQPLVSKPYNTSVRAIEYHGPYLGGNGFATVVSSPQLTLFDPMIPPPIANNTGPTGPNVVGLFVSEFGAVVGSSFESLSPSLGPASWSVHASVMYQRSWALDNFIKTYWGTGQNLDAVGEKAFRKQLYQAQLAQALYIQSSILQRRSVNQWGCLVWQLNEIWPAMGSWGSYDYQVERWRPLHYFYRDGLFTDVVTGCGENDCYVRYDNTVSSMVGLLVVLEYIDLRNGNVLETESVSVPDLPPAAASIYWWKRPPVPTPITHTILRMTCYNSSKLISTHIDLLTTPSQLYLPAASITIQEASDHVIVSSDNVALYVVLTTPTPGYFLDNVFLLLPGEKKTVGFVAARQGENLTNVSAMHVQAAQ
jgi:beta-mannosidase